MSAARRIVAGLVAAYLLLVLADRFVLVELFLYRCGWPLLAAFIVGLAAIGAGSFAKRDVATRLLVGYPIFGAICFLFALMKASVWTMAPLVVLFAALGAWQTVRRTGSPAGPGPAGPPALPLLLLFLSILVLAQAPPSSLDELAYHLAIPHTWLLEGRAIDLPLISHSYFPLGIESADLPLLAALGPLDGGIASHFLHLLAALAAAVVIHRKARSRLVTAAILTTPALLLTAGWSLVDFPLLGICAVLFDEDDERTIAAAVGAGLLTKYTFIPFALIVLLLTRRYRGTMVGGAIGSVFFIRNLILTWDPIAPFFQPGTPRFIGYRGAPFLSDYVFDPRFLDEALGASLLTTAALATTLAAGALALFGVVLFLLAPSSRLLIPFFGVASLTARPDRRWLRALIAIAVAVQLVLVVVSVERTGAFGLISGRLSDEEYLRRARRSYDGISWLNQALPARSRTLVIGLNETYWFERAVRGGGNFDGERVSHYLEAATPDALRLRLARDGITHVAVFNLPLETAVARKIEERQTTLSPAARRSVAELLDRYAASVTSRGDVTLFALR
ncbi:MAG TPA: hypothetical protein VGR02_09745 [Thermoanaerobaculia bacterium]|nr:hypothetical protein [Thermoanaerobaculia bacterium]